MKDSKKCSRCKSLKPISSFYKNKDMADGYSFQCKDCDYVSENKSGLHRIKWNREHKDSLRKSNEEWKKRNPAKVQAEKLVKKAIKEGTLIRKSCEKCGNEKSHGHHDNYNKPLEVRWLCAKHHKEAHGYRTAENYKLKK